MAQPQIIVSLWDGEPQPDKKNYLGCGVCVAPDKVLTAKHVPCPVGKQEIPFARLRAGLSGIREGGMLIHSVEHHPERDISLLVLRRPHEKPVVACNATATLQEGGQVELLAYNMAEACLKGPIPVNLTNWSQPDSWEFHTEPAHGMSGGAVLLDNKLVGIIQARDDSQNGGIIIPLSAIHAFLSDHLQLAHLPASPEPDEQLEQEDQQFLQDIHGSITANWKTFPPLSQSLAKAYNVLVGTALTERLIKECEHGHFSDIIQCLQTIFTDCRTELEPTEILKYQNLLKSAESLVSHLALFNVRKDWLHAYRNHHASIGKPHHWLPKMKLESVHVAFSRQTRVVPSFREPSRKAESIKSLGNMFMLETGTGKNDASVTLVLQALYAMFNSDSLEIPDNNQDIAEEISESIRLYKNHKDVRFRQCPFILVPQAETADAAYSKLAQLIPELEWVTLETDGNQNIFVIRDVQLMTAIRQFFRTLEG